CSSDGSTATCGPTIGMSWRRSCGLRLPPRSCGRHRTHLPTPCCSRRPRVRRNWRKRRVVARGDPASPHAPRKAKKLERAYLRGVTKQLYLAFGLSSVSLLSDTPRRLPSYRGRYHIRLIHSSASIVDQ